MKEAELIAKVDEDFHGARGRWNADIAEWVFVHNDGRGLPPNAVRHIDGLRQAHAPLAIETWSEPELLKLTMDLELAALQALFGPAASIAIVDRLDRFAVMSILCSESPKLEPERLRGLAAAPILTGLQQALDALVVMLADGSQATV